MKFSKRQYEEIVLVLENESAFYKQYTARSKESFGCRRSFLTYWLGYPGQSGRADLPCWVQNSDIEDRDQLRRYFDDRYEITSCEINKYGHIPDWWKVPETKHEPPKEPAMAIYTPVSTPTLKEPIMSKPIIVSTKTFVDGIDVATMTNDSIYAIIAEQEARIEQLSKLKAQPKRLAEEIAKRQAGITALVEYLDSQPA